MDIYSPAIAQIDLIFSSLESLQNVESLENNTYSTLPITEVLSPLTIAQYSLYNTDLEDDEYGTTNNIYLVYEGGFITQDDKINNKKSNLEIRGNLTVRENTYFYSSIDLANNSIRNVKNKDTRFVSEVLKSTAADREAMTVGDFRRNSFDKGMIMMWSGTYDELYYQLPNWRLCGRPDSDVGIVNGVTIPNLESSFIIGAGYTGNNTYSPRDNKNAPFGSNINISIGTTGGYNAISLKQAEMPIHKHSIEYIVTGGGVSLYFITNNVRSDNVNLYSRNLKGNDTVFEPVNKVASSACVIEKNYWGPANKTKYYDTGCYNAGCNGCGCNCCTGSSCGPYAGGDGYPTWGTGSGLLSASRTPLELSELTLVDNPLGVKTLTQQTIGADEAHENRPPYYVLGFIIHVGVGR